MKRAVICLALLAVSSTAHAKPKPAPVPPAEQVIKAEQAFDAYTAVHGFKHGFYQFSAPTALGFNPAPAPTHSNLATVIAKDPSESDAPSLLRWWPSRIGVASSGELAYDLGGWTYDTNPEGGWFLTVWQKQADGSWLWLIDARAGQAPLADIPAKMPTFTDFAPGGHSDTPDIARSEVLASEASLNKALNLQAATTAYNGFLLPNAVIAAPTTKPADTPDTRRVALAARPEGLAWKSDTQGLSISGDFAYTYGRTTTDDHNAVVKGHYIRIWRKDGPALADWHIVVDLYMPA